MLFEGVNVFPHGQLLVTKYALYALFYATQVFHIKEKTFNLGSNDNAAFFFLAGPVSLSTADTTCTINRFSHSIDDSLLLRMVFWRH